MTIKGHIVDINSRYILIDDKKYKHNFSDYQKYLKMINSDIEADIEIIDGEEYVIETKAVLYTSNISEDLEPENLAVDRDATTYSRLTLNPYSITGDISTETAYVIGQEPISSMNYSCIRFKLKSNNGKEVVATMFTDDPHNAPDYLNTIVRVIIYKKGNYFNIQQIEVEESIILKDPKVELCTDFVKKKVIASGAYDDLTIEKVLNLLNSEEIVLMAYRLNIALMMIKLTPFNLKELIQGIVYQSFDKLAVELPKGINRKFLSTQDIRILVASQMKLFNAKIHSYNSLESEKSFIERELLQMINEQADKMYSLEYAYNPEVVKC